MYHNSKGTVYFSYNNVGETLSIKEQMDFTSMNDLFSKLVKFFNDYKPQKFSINSLIIDNYLGNKPNPENKNYLYHETKVCNEKSNNEVIKSLHFFLVQLLFDSGKDNYTIMRDEESTPSTA